MKLLITLDFPPQKGGIQNYLYEIAKHKYSENDIIITSGPKCKDDNKLKSKINRVPTIFYKKASLILMFPLFVKYLISNKRIVIESGNIYSAILPWFLSFFTKTEYDVYTYGTELIPLKKINMKTLILRSILNKANTIYSLLESQKDVLFKITDNRNIKIISPKIEVNLKWKKKEISPKSPLQLLTVGRLVKHKGHNILINAVSKLAIDYNLTIIGSGPEHSNLLEQINNLSLHDKIKIKNNIPKEGLLKYYQSSDIFILPSLELESGREGFGIVLLEAMSNSLPIIASNCGGIPEVLGHGDFGILVEPGNIDSLSQAIMELKRNTSRQRQLSQKAFNHLVENYAW